MRALFLLLVAANLAFFAWARYVAPPEAVADPLPLARQMDPQKLKVVSPAELAAPVARAAPPAAPPLKCVEWGSFSAADEEFLKRLAAEGIIWRHVGKGTFFGRRPAPITPKDLSELAICLIGRHFKAQYEFYAHARLAKEAGLSAEFVEAIRTRQTPPFKREQERVVYDFVTEYLATNRVSAPNYKRAVDAFGEPGVVDLVGVCGYYMLVSMTLNVFEMPLPPGEPEPLV